jgi:hypothetical protein
MVEDQQEPAWIANLLNEQQQGPTEDAGERMAQADMVDDLRAHIATADEELGLKEKGPLARMVTSLGLEPWQRLVLAVFLFLDVALCGCMALVMAGRVGLPF